MRDVGRALLSGHVNGQTARAYAQVNREVRRDLIEGSKAGLDESILLPDGEPGKEGASQECSNENDRLCSLRELVTRREEDAIIAQAERILRERQGR